MEARMAELVALAIIVICAVDGKNRGLVGEAYSLAKIVLVVVLTFLLSTLIRPRLPEFLPGKSGVAYSVAILVSVIVVAFADYMLQLIKKIPVVSTLDQVGGVLVGIVVGFVIDWLAVEFILAFGDMQWANQGAVAIQGSVILSQLAQLNIFS